MHKVAHVFIGCCISTAGILILRHAHLVTGGAPGLALSLSYLFGIPFSVAFLLTNSPFYVLSIFGMGWRFTLTTLAAASLLAGMTEVDRLLGGIVVSDLTGAVLGGALAGLGLAYLFWNGASLGGVNILTLYVNRRWGFDPGKATLVMDAMVVLSGVYAVGLSKACYSVLSIVIVASVISFFKQRISQANQAKAAV